LDVVFLEDFLWLFSNIADSTNPIAPNNPTAISKLFMALGKLMSL
tara:strand:+ start:72 stop:206 length:135 start_codon:yes stop_codon:yes gene_type:complete